MSKFFKFISNKSPLEYMCCEKMVFSIFAMEDEKKISCEHIRWEIIGDDGKKLNGEGFCTQEKPLTLETELDSSGFVHIICTAVDDKGNAIADFDVLDAGAGADIKNIKYHDIIPDDFDGYWDDIERTVGQFPINVLSKKQLINNVQEGFIAFDIQIETPSGRPASGCLTIPDKDGKFPIKVMFAGYGISGGGCFYEKDTITAYFNAHGIENCTPMDELEKKYHSELSEYGFSDKENSSNMTTYFRNMMIRNLIAVKYLKTLSCWNGINLTAIGGSQGALQATTVAAHDNGVTYLCIDVPWFCDLNAINYGFLRGWRPNFAEGLRYFDTVAQASRVKCPVSITAGLGDYICPPSSVMSLYNSFNCKKEMKFMQSRTHSYSPPEIEEFKIH